MCGGTAIPYQRLYGANGLSPRVRGNPPVGAFTRSVNRSIPACAGEPQSNWRDTTASGVYPRVCGGTATKTVLKNTPDGLSPRVRGNH